MSHFTTNNITNFSNNQNSFNVSNNYTVADDRSQLLSWLSPLDPGLRHWEIQERRVDNIGEWLIHSEEFKRWCKIGGDGECDKEGVLFCYGDPGAGKTFISSLVVDRLGNQAIGKNTAVAFFYFDFAARKEQSAASMLGSLLKQIISGMERIPEEISRALQEHKMAIGGRRPQLADVVKMLQLITSSQYTIMCIDALDECVGVQRAKLLDSLNQILAKSPGTRVFATGRPHIRTEIERRFFGRVVTVSIGPTKEDIITYLRVRLSEDETPEEMNENLEADILEEIPQHVSEMFLLVSLNIEAILQESTIYRRREQLSKISDGLGLGDTYDATIERIRAQGGGKSQLGMEALMWISYAERPLSADELCHALAVELGSKSFNSGNIPSMSTVVGCCQGLITVDKEASTVRLIHFTLREYLSAHGIFSSPHSVMAEICLTYLNSEHVKALSPYPSSRARDTTCLEYCSQYWGVHAKKELSDCARSLAQELFQQYNGPGHVSTELLLYGVESLSGLNFDTYSPFSGLHCASFFGISKIVAALIEMEYSDLNEGDFGGHTPLSWAACNGHEEVVKILLEREGVNPNKPSNHGETPLLRAALSGHEEMVKILLGRDEVNPDEPDNNGQTPLLWAAGDGHEGVVKILLERDEVDPDKPSNYGETPLLLAALCGHEQVVKMLLMRDDANPDIRDTDGRTPLSNAATNGHEGVVKLLLQEHRVNPDKPDHHGSTPLSLAAEHGHENVVKILIGRDEVNLENLDNDGDTPLSCAAIGGCEGVVKILLEQEGVNPDNLNHAGQTPLSIAARKGYPEVVKILLEREEVDPNKADNEGQTPLMHAAKHSHQGVIELLQPRQVVTHGALSGLGDITP